MAWLMLSSQPQQGGGGGSSRKAKKSSVARNSLDTSRKSSLALTLCAGRPPGKPLPK
eukprot:CAMPEP_0194753138 /NCGR_PEP_ID=MMETSP0323_2-20130528/7085_1 /TAXON_ID=2866 ORGANISM="Crypthecodinium cohnii, Strain Seligo" /NCGR_SAMPLE_ID=MMETSP0323_2 /ASSEMBLY_ACC=CAM_ASM_000346 /LENGTH=56 /DNA_ID=CAMNT_0039670759 /DNA_START=148 /DNA_END=318 /DNA_ORIENTATION=-